MKLSKLFKSTTTPASILAACGTIGVSVLLFADDDVTSSIQVDVWSDNWFAMYVGDELVAEDSVSIMTERSFNKETFNIDIDLPAQISFVVKDYKANDTGLEYIGTNRQQMGDGGFIAQLIDSESGFPVLTSNANWRCLPIHIAPLDKQCEKSSSPETDCESNILDEPDGWKSASFDDSSWPMAIEYSERAIGVKDGYQEVTWVDEAKLIWTSDLEADNTLLCRATLVE